MKNYLDFVKYVFDNGVITHNRTGIDTIACSGYMFTHDMKDGFPILTTKKMGIKNIASELEMFINGITSKKFLQDKGNKIWNDWCNPKKVPYENDPDTKKKMAEEDDLGPIYGKQWVCFNGDPVKGNQLKSVIDTIKKDPTSRRLVVSAWNPLQLDEMALPPCHMIFEVLVYPDQGTIDLMWFQRSSDIGLGVPYDISSYALLLTLIAKETGYTPGKLIGYFGSCHIYVNQIEALKEQLTRPCHKLPTLNIKNWTSIWNWHYNDVELVNYECETPIKMEIAV